MFTDTAFNQTLEIFTTVLPSNYPVYWHCFLSNLAQFQKWSRKLTNLFIGISPKAIVFTCVKEALPHIPLDKILLETNVPLQPLCGQAEYSHRKYGNPYHVNEVAKFVATCKTLSTSLVHAKTLHNTHSFFNS